MIKVKRAPAGYIASVFSDTRAHGQDNGHVYTQEHAIYLSVTGNWNSSRDEAINTCRAECKVKTAKIDKRIAKLKTDIAALERDRRKLPFLRPLHPEERRHR